MRGQECQAAALQMCADQSGDQFDGGAIQCNIGLVEYPQGAPFINQAGERDPALLPLREITAGQGFATSQSDLLKGIECTAFIKRLISQPGAGL